MKKTYTFESLTGMTHEQYEELENKNIKESNKAYANLLNKNVTPHKFLINSLYRKRLYLLKKFKNYISEYPQLSTVINDSYVYIQCKIKEEQMNHDVFSSVYFFTQYMSDEIETRFMVNKKREYVLHSICQMK